MANLRIWELKLTCQLSQKQMGCDADNDEIGIRYNICFIFSNQKKEEAYTRKYMRLNPLRIIPFSI